MSVLKNRPKEKEGLYVLFLSSNASILLSFKTARISLDGLNAPEEPVQREERKVIVGPSFPFSLEKDERKEGLCPR